MSISIGFAQVNDNFSDGDFQLNPTWRGDDSKFLVENFQLRLKAPAASGSAYLTTDCPAINDAVWEFFAQMDFNPSGSNYAKIYLVSDNSDLTAPLNGYFLLIGGTPDEVSLFRQSATTDVKIIDGIDGLLNISAIKIKIKVTRDHLGNWELFTDLGVTGSYTHQGSAFDDTFLQNSFLGLQCIYTATRSDRFYFDDILVTGNPYTDTTPPSVVSVEVLTDKSLLIKFDESLGESTTLLRENYVVDQGVGMPVEVKLLPGNDAIELTFKTPFRNGYTHQIVLSSLTDSFGNLSAPLTLPFFFFQSLPVAAKDVVISEILPDPAPPVNLPEAEFIELYNRSQKPFDLSGWTISDGRSIAVFPEHYFLPQDYLILTATSNQGKFGNLPVLGLANFPTLNNSSDTLILKSSGGLRIDSINYDMSWYQSDEKQDGGWSLEIIDPENLCGEGNWVSSENDSGGTPGFENSVAANKPDLRGPWLLNAVVIDEKSLGLTFNEQLATPLPPNAIFNLTPATPVEVYSFADKALKTLLLQLSLPLEKKQVYTLEVRNIYDCSGNEIDNSSNTLQFAVPEVATPLDIVINEVLFNPRSGGADFVEIYNQSDKYLNLKNWQTGNMTDDGLANGRIITTDDFLLGPETFLVLTVDPENIQTNYPQSSRSKFLKTTLPAMPNDEGSIALVSPELEIIDSFAYDKSLHSVFLKDDEGVSLERISLADPTNSKANWTSASSVAGFASPGFVNSSARPSGVNPDEEVTVDPPIFSPGSGYPEFSTILFKFDKPGFVANVKIFDQQGRLIKTIANNELLGTNGTFRWEGDQEDGSRARSGYYLVWFEIFDNSGEVRSFRKRLIIASR